MEGKLFTIGLIGYGTFGKFLTSHFTKSGYKVVVISLRTNYTKEAVEDGLEIDKTYFQGAEKIGGFFEQNLDCVIFSVSIISFESVLDLFVPHIKNHLIVDVLSVKSHPKEKFLKKLPQSADILCTHPMFGPESGKLTWEGLSFVYEKVRISNEARCNTFIDLWKNKGCRMVEMTCDEHDKLAANTQFVTHFTSRVLEKLNLQSTPIDTKSFQTLHGVASSMTRDSYDLFYALCRFNPHAMAKLKEFESALYQVKGDLQTMDEKLSIKTTTDSIVFSPKVTNLEASKTVKITDLARELSQQGIEVISFSVGEPDYAPPKAALQGAINAINTGKTRYTALAGIPELRKSIAKYLKEKKNTEYSPEEILCSCGAKQSIYQALVALVRPGDEVLIPSPYWVSYPEMVKLAGGKPVDMPTTVASRFCITPEQLENAININTRAIILCNPSNPTGYVYTKEQLEKLVVVLEKHPHVFIISDEIYEKITYDIEHVSFASLKGMWNRTLTVNGFSKLFAMTGFRLGYIAAPKIIIQACTKIQGHITTNPASIAQYAAVEALENTEPSYFTDAIEGFKKKRDLVVSELMRAGVDCPPPEGAFYVFFNVEKFLSKDIPTSEDLCMFLLKEFKVALVPGEAFGLGGHLRMSYATSIEQLTDGMKRIAEGLLSLKPSNN